MRHLLIAHIVGALLFAGGLAGWFISAVVGDIIAGVGVLVFVIATIMNRMKSGEP